VKLRDEFVPGIGNLRSGLCHAVALQAERHHVNSGATEVIFSDCS